MATTTSPTSASRSSPTRRDHIFSFEFKPTGKADIAKGKGVPGSITLLLDGAPVGKGDLPVTIPLSLGLSAGVSIGSDAGAPVMPDYKPPFAFTGTVTKALVDVTGEAVEDMAARAVRERRGRRGAGGSGGRSRVRFVNLARGNLGDFAGTSPAASYRTSRMRTSRPAIMTASPRPRERTARASGDT